LIAWVGCLIDAYEQEQWFGDDIRLKGHMRRIDFVGAKVLCFAAAHIGSGRAAPERGATPRPAPGSTSAPLLQRQAAGQG
jgi:hypothetical protein